MLLSLRLLSFTLFLFLFTPYSHHRDLLSFPTRRSSDLVSPCPCRKSISWPIAATSATAPRAAPRCWRSCSRSEEHTSELQSHHELVCRLLLEKKKTARVASNTANNNLSNQQ